MIYKVLNPFGFELGWISLPMLTPIGLDNKFVYVLNFLLITKEEKR